MKRKFAALLVALAWLALLAGCSGQQASGPREAVQEPDTDARTLTRAIGEHQTVVYRFHTEPRVSISHDPAIYLALFDKDVETFDQADNWATAWLGAVPSLGQSFNAFDVKSAPSTPEEGAWKGPVFDSPARRAILAPYGDMEEVEAADMVLTFTRSGQNVRAVLEVDGAKAWVGQQAIRNMGSGTVYLYLYPQYRTLSQIQFQDMGSAGIALSGWQRLLLILGALAVAFAVHTLAKKGEDALFFISGGAAFLTAGLSLCSGVLALVIYGRSHPEALSKLSAGYIPLQLQAAGPGFWIPAALSGLGVVGLLAFFISQAWGIPYSVPRVLAAFPLGFCHALWYAVVALVVLSLLNQVVGLIVAVIGIVALYFLGKVFLEMEKRPHVEVSTTTRTYNSMGDLVDVKYDTEYIPLPEDKAGKG